MFNTVIHPVCILDIFPEMEYSESLDENHIAFKSWKIPRLKP